MIQSKFQTSRLWPLLAEDLEHVAEHTGDVWRRIRGSRIFITGGTGFFGCWLVETFLDANRRLQLGSEIAVLTRSRAAFQAKAPHLVSDSALTIIEGDLRDFSFPEGDFAYVIHAAAAVTLPQTDPVDLIDAEIAGLQHIFAFARHAKAMRMLFTSSGGIYGAQSGDAPITETAATSLDPSKLGSFYGELKRLGELYGACYALQYGLEVVVARCFSAFGPYQNMNSHFAAANFIADALAGRDIEIQGDGLAQRSYLYGADLVIWLWQLLTLGRFGTPYNVGSSIPVSIFDLAQAVTRVADNELKVRVLGKAKAGLAPQWYIPDVKKAEKELGLVQRIGMEEGLKRTITWNRKHE